MLSIGFAWQTLNNENLDVILNSKRLRKYVKIQIQITYIKVGDNVLCRNESACELLENETTTEWVEGLDTDTERPHLPGPGAGVLLSTSMDLINVKNNFILRMAREKLWVSCSRF